MPELPAHEYERLAAVAAGPDLDRLISRRNAGEPLQYLEGTAPFGPLDLVVDPRVLIPRPETEQLWELAVEALGDAGPGTAIVDIGTGSGALALALKHAFPKAQVYGTDLSGDALEVARENAARLGLEVTYLQGDLFEALPQRLMGRIDLLVSNPPYVAAGEWGNLPVDVRHEPRAALVAGPEGTEVLARIADDAYWWLGVGGYVICEIGETQGAAADGLFFAFDRGIRQDLTGRDRFVVGRKGAACCV